MSSFINKVQSIKDSLRRNFVFADQVGEILSLSFVSGKNTLLYGRGGHGKSEMVRSVFSSLTEGANDIFIQSFGEGMTEARLYGGLDLKALNCAENPRMIYHPENSFLNKEFVLFEELFDAPPVVLLSLKDTLTDRRLNNGAQVFPMKTKMLVAATNKDPAEISELGDSAHALTERFPLQLCVEWETYTQNDFIKLFNLIDIKGEDGGVIFSTSVKGYLASIVAEAHEKGDWISPRQAVACLDVVRASALINGHREVKEEDLFSIKFIPGTENVLDGLSERLTLVKKEFEATEILLQFEKLYEKATDYLNSHDSPIRLLQEMKRIQPVEAEISKLQVPDSLYQRKTDLTKKISQVCLKLRDKAQMFKPYIPLTIVWGICLKLPKSVSSPIIKN